MNATAADTSFDLALPGAWLSAALLLLLFVALFLRELRQGAALPPRPRFGLILLRALLLAMLWLVLVQPRIWVPELRRLPGPLMVLFDDSASMALGPLYSERAAKLKAYAAAWQSETQEVMPFAFGTHLRPLSGLEAVRGLSFRAPSTPLGSALLELAQQSPKGARILVVSDGASADPLPIEALRRSALPVHAIALGPRSTPSDRAILEVEAPAQLRVDEESRLRVRLRVRGRQGSSVNLRLRCQGHADESRSLRVEEGKERSLEWAWTPKRSGALPCEFALAPSSRDRWPQNDRWPFVLHVAPARLRVLLVSGRPSWDLRYLRAFLKEEPAIDLVSFFVLRHSTDSTGVTQDELSLIPFPTDELFREHLERFDLLIFHDFGRFPAPFDAHLERVRDYVRRGGSLVMVGGELSFAEGGYGSTPLAEILPVALETRASENVWVEDYRVTPHAAAATHPLVDLAPELGDAAAYWRGLAPLRRLNHLGAPKKGSVTLLESAGKGSSGRPLLVIAQAGKGRVAALATDESWRWGMASAAESGEGPNFARFWDRLLRWLSRHPSLEESQIEVDPELAPPGQRRRLRAQLRRPLDYRPLAAREVEVLLQDLEGRTLRRLQARTDAEGRLDLPFELPEAVGAYALRLRGADPSVENSRAWAVVRPSEEILRLEGKPKSLARLAAATGGRFFEAPSKAPKLADFAASRREVVRTRLHQPLSHPLAFLALLLFALLEWGLRRRFGQR